MKKHLILFLTLILTISCCFTACSSTKNDAEAYDKLNSAAQNVTQIASAMEGGWNFSINNTDYSATELRKYYIRDFAKAIGFSEDAVRTLILNLTKEPLLLRCIFSIILTHKKASLDMMITVML